MLADDLVTIAAYGTPQEASIAKGLLEDEGIHCYLVGTESGHMLSFVGAGNALGGVKLQVAEHDAEEAAQILDTLGDSETSTAIPAWNCARCGEHVDAGFDRCWSCGTTFDVAASTTSGENLQEPTQLDTEDLQEESAEKTDSGDRPESTEELASRAFKSAVLGIGLIPLEFYALYLLVKLSGHELSGSALKKYYASTGIALFMLVAWMSILVYFAG